MDELGSALRHSDEANFRVTPFLYMPEGTLNSALRIYYNTVQIIQCCYFLHSFLQTNLQDEVSSLASRVKESDAQEIGAFYYEHYTRVLDKGDQADRAQLGKTYQTSNVLFEVLCAINISEEVEEVTPEIIAASKDVQAKKKLYAPYNILPLDSSGESQAIMQFKEVIAAVDALRNTSGLNWPPQSDQYRSKSGELDVLDWLRVMFGFQRDNVRNQRENLILLLSNVHIKLIPKPEPTNKSASWATRNSSKKDTLHGPLFLIWGALYARVSMLYIP